MKLNIFVGLAVGAAVTVSAALVHADDIRERPEIRPDDAG